MSDKFKLFHRILLAELKDLEDDITSWSKFLEKKHIEDKVTEYVYLQNSALFHQELKGVSLYLHTVTNETLSASATIEQIRDHYLALLDEEIKTYLFENAIRVFVQRKIEKVYQFLKD